MFYWFFKHQDTDAPLVVWINGGPGATSMFGLFVENGPLKVTRTGTGQDDFKVEKRESWADGYNIVYIDQPTGSGFSFGDSYVEDMHQLS